MAGPHHEPTRRLVLAAGAAGGAASLLTGCLGDRSPSSAPAGPPADVPRWAPGPGEPAGARRGGRVITAWSNEAQSYDPAIGWDLHSWEAISTVLYAPLYQYAGQFDGPAPHAAQGAPQVSKDGRVYTIPLRRDVRFHNGRPVVAEDYVYTWTRLMDPGLASWASSYLFGIEGAEEVYEEKAERIRGLSAPDPYTLRVTLTEPDVLFPALLCMPYTAALPREEVRRLGAEFGRTPVGSGPMRITRYDSKGRRAVFEPFDQYFWRGTPLIERLEYRWGIGYPLQALQLSGGRVDVLGEGLVASQAARFTADASMRERFVQAVPVRGTQWLSLNHRRRELRDPRVRRALNWAVDREQLMRLTFGLSDPWGSPFPKRLDRFRRTAKPYAYDPERARALLREAGVEKLKLEFLHGTQDPWPLLGQVLQQQFEAVGVELSLNAMSQPAFELATSDGKGDLYGSHLYITLNSALELVSSNFTSDASYNYLGYANARVDSLAVSARKARSTEAANSLLAEIEDELVRDAAGVFLGSMNFLAARAPEVRNYQMRGETGTYYDRLWVKR
ncbi:ABC transporter substrate-binding protein [Streptomyces sp. NPDC088729]|uniref:ABC transporter substrate-binding protein n=1 Tax=Streptomyces sp. NPDC088729 TaxID=3365876 RepID=UPI00381B1598